MKWLPRLREHVARMLTSPGAELGRGAAFVQFQVRLWYFCLRRLRENNALAMSSALSFRTIFALVPTIVLGVVVLKSLGYLEDSKRALGKLLTQSGFAGIAVVQKPATAPASASRPDRAPAETQPRSLTAAEVIQRAVSQVEAKLTFGRLGPIGVALLIWAALTLVTTIERSLNRIFGAPRSRSLGRRVLLYWAAMTLGPIALVLADYASGEAVAFFGRVGGLSLILAAVGWVQPIVVGVAVLTALYVWLPNTQVSKRAALGGAVLAFPAWLVARWAFCLYVREVVGTNPLYGSLGLLPLFLMWLNLSWWIILFGAEFAHAAASAGDLAAAERAERTFLGPWELLAASLAVAARHAAGAGPATAAQVVEGLRLPQASVQVLLDRLAGADVICRVQKADEPAYVPARAPAAIQVAEVLAFGGPPGREPSALPFQADLARAVQRVRQAAQESLAGKTLADVLAGR